VSSNCWDAQREIDPADSRSARRCSRRTVDQSPSLADRQTDRRLRLAPPERRARRRSPARTRG
jgi:hypothetical protein